MSIGVMLLPAYTPPLPEHAHLTVVYAGEEVVPSILAVMHERVRMLASCHRAFAARVLGTAMFGENHNEPVLLIQETSEIALMRSALQVYSKSEYDKTGFRPHVAVPKLLSTMGKLPTTLYFNKITLWTRENSGYEHWLGL